MDFKEKIETIKALLSGKFEAAPAAVEQAASEGAPTYENSATTKTGEIDQWNGELAVGTELYCVTPTGIMPCKDGVEEFEDGTLVTVAGGKVTAITPPSQSAAPEAGAGSDMNSQFKSVEDVTKGLLKFEGAADLATITAVLKWMFNEQYGWMLQQKQRESQMESIVATVSGFKKVEESTEQLHKENTAIKEAFAKTVELVELFNANPKTDEKPVNAAFSKVADKEANLAKLAEAIKNISK